MEALKYCQLPNSKSSLNDVCGHSEALVTESSTKSVCTATAEQKKDTENLRASRSELSLKVKSINDGQNNLQICEQAPWKHCRVVIRIHPQDQKNDETNKCIRAEWPNRIVINTGKGHQPHTLDFDAVLDESTSQRDVYETVAKPLVEFVLQGYNGCVLTYGTPGSGKSYSLQGGNLSGKQRGIISRAAEDLFNTVEKTSYKVTASYIQVSNEKIYDLLNIQHSEKIRIHESDNNVSVEGLTEVDVTSVEDLLQVFRKGALNRNAGVSKGDFSNSSHTLFYISIVRTNINTEKSEEKYITTGKLTLVDLAGSGQVVFALSTPGCQHIPYRESKLTRILRDCLGGNCVTSLIVTVSSGGASVHETLSILQFATRARSIVNCAGKNTHKRSSKDQAHNETHVERPAERETGAVEEYMGEGNKKGSQTQTCLPPICIGRNACSRFVEKNLRNSLSRAAEFEDQHNQKVILPHLEKGTAKSLTTTKAVTNLDKSKAADDRFKNIRSWPNTLFGSVNISRESRVEKQQYKLDKMNEFELLSPKTPMETNPFEAQKNTECPNCKKERRIRDEYDKFILQSKRDKDSLQQRIMELEIELKKYKGEGKELAPAAEEVVREHLQTELDYLQSTRRCSQKVAADEKVLHIQQEEHQYAAVLQERDDLLVEVEELKAQLDKNSNNERILVQTINAEKCRVILEKEELSSQLEKTKECEKRKITDLENEKDHIQLELEDTKIELEKLKETQNENLIELRKEKVMH
ncbi:kinesin-like protein klp-20 isoform X2 [Scyliorhinus canicula]|uniref:kinesin-like protein klp-20 isoform X2 n=1 Tax=Scyliorhinus canicula TaxID=7830 RepID=UPI0018F4229B|nr:kinesin-like protein klp-20 isoform X2 [Scyliorhinus canicula]